MPASSTSIGATTRKRAVNLTLSEGLVALTKTYTSNLSATMEDLLVAYVAQQETRLTRQQQADAASMDWNAVHALVGSFADDADKNLKYQYFPPAAHSFQ